MISLFGLTCPPMCQEILSFSKIPFHLRQKTYLLVKTYTCLIIHSIVLSIAFSQQLWAKRAFHPLSLIWHNLVKFYKVFMQFWFFSYNSKLEKIKMFEMFDPVRLLTWNFGNEIIFLKLVVKMEFQIGIYYYFNLLLIV